LKEKYTFFNDISAAKRHAIAILTYLSKIAPKFTANDKNSDSAAAIFTNPQCLSLFNKVFVCHKTVHSYTNKQTNKRL